MRYQPEFDYSVIYEYDNFQEDRLEVCNCERCGGEGCMIVIPHVNIEDYVHEVLCQSCRCELQEDTGG